MGDSIRCKRARIERDSWRMGKDDGGAEAFYGRSRGRLPVQAVSPHPASEVSDYPNGVQPFPVAGLPSYYLLYNTCKIKV